MASPPESREWAVQLLFQLDYNPGELGPAFKDFWNEKAGHGQVARVRRRIGAGRAGQPAGH